MAAAIPTSTLEKFTTFGDLLRYLRRRAGITQVELSLAVGYSNAQISRLEQNLRPPDLTIIEARFVPALGLEQEPNAVARLLELAANVRREDAPSTGLCPYKGLSYFDEPDADLFVGRELLAAKLVQRVLHIANAPAGNFRFLAIVGASGSGKSSLVRAGLIPALRWDPASAGWPIHVLTPTVHPTESLAGSLAEEHASVAATARFSDDLMAEPRSLHFYARNAVTTAGATHLLLLVDQFEELFTLCRGEAERQAFIDNLLLACADEGGPTVVIIALRADFYTHCAAYPKLREALACHQEFIGAMSDEELRRAIDEPARRGRWELEPGLVDLLARDVGHEPGALPLLSHALLETWERRRGHTMTLGGYASSGGVRGAIAETAQSVFTDQFTPEQQAIARRVFLSLTELGSESGTGDTRRRVTLDELTATPGDSDATRLVLTALADSRLVTITGDSVEVAHEALIREWPTLRGWLEDDREVLRLHRQLSDAAHEWARLSREGGALYRGARLNQVREWTAAHPDEMSPLEREFLDASVQAADREAAERELQRQNELEAAQKLAEAERERATEQVRTSNRLRLRNRIISGVGAFALLLAILASMLGWKAAQNADQVRQNLVRVEGLRLAAESKSIQDRDLSAALLVGIEAFRKLNSAETRGALLDGSQAKPELLQFLIGHTDDVESVAFSPDGTLLASGSDDHTIILWDVATRKPIGEPLHLHSSPVYAIAFSPNGKLLASAGADHMVTLWDVATRQPVGASLKGHWDELYTVAFSPDGKTVAAGGADENITLWDVESHHQIGQRMEANAGGVSKVTFSPDGKMLASAGLDGTVRLWDIRTRQPAGLPLVITNAVPGNLDWNDAAFDVAFSPDGKTLAVSDCRGAITLWDATTHRRIGLPIVMRSGICVYSIAFSRDGQTLASGGGRGDIQLWDVATQKPVGPRLSADTNSVSSVAFRPDGRMLAAGSGNHSIILWSLESPVPAAQRASSSAGDVDSLRFSPDGNTLTSIGRDGTLVLWDAVSHHAVGSHLAGNVGSGIRTAFSPDGKMIASGGADKKVILWDAVTHQPLGQSLEGHNSWVSSVAFSPDGRMLASGSGDQSIILWDVATHHAIERLMRSWGGTVSVVAFSPDRKTLAAGYANGIIVLWDLATYRGYPVDGHTQYVDALTFSPDGKILVSAADDRTTILWDMVTRKPLGEPMVGSWVPSSLALSRDGKMLAVGSFDGTIVLWNVATREPLGQPLTGHTGWVHSVAFNPNGKILASGSTDGTILIWDVDPESQIEKACQRVGRNFTQAEWKTYFAGEPYRQTCPEWPAGN
jgi:WD40 repeat protein